MPAFLTKSSTPRAYAVALALLAVGLACGGASRLDVMAPLGARLAAVVALAWLLWRRPLVSVPVGRPALVLAALVVVLPLAQLVPLPFGWWSALPGRSMPGGNFQLVGLAPALPLSLAPARTLNAVLALLPPIALWLVAATLDAEARGGLLRLVVVVALGGALLGIAQALGDRHGPLYLYAITTEGASVGLFANANHHALFLAIAIVLVAVWLGDHARRDAVASVNARVAAGAAVALLTASLVLTQSRAGLAFLVVALAASGWIATPRTLGIASRRTVLAGAAGAVVVVALVVASQRGMFGTDLAIDIRHDGRIGNLPLFAHIVASFWPVGSGFGSFDPVFRSFETADTVSLNYLNQAHNEYAQIAIEGGLPALLLLVAFMAWLVRTVPTALRDGAADGRVRRQRRAAVVVVGLALVHSGVDYPLRTAAMAMVFALALALFAPPADTRRVPSRLQ